MTLSELEEEARKRKERLAEWKLNKQRQTTKRKEYEDDDDVEKTTGEKKESEIEFPKPIFRNYKPLESTQLGGAIVLPKPTLIDIKPMIEDQVKGKHSVRGSGTNSLSDDVDLLTLAPRKPDWDLKRDVEKKLKRLEKRTARAIGELTRERLIAAQEQSETSLAEVVATTSKLNEAPQDDDD